VFDRSLIIEGIGEADQKRLIKIVTLTAKVSINQLMTIDNKYLVVGNSDGNIRFYDFQFKVAAWFENLNVNAIKSISFSTKEPVYASEDRNDDTKNEFACSDFIIADSSAQIIELKSSIFEAIESANNKGISRMVGLQSSITAIAVHPKKPILAIAGDGFIILWDYIKKTEIAHQFEDFGKSAKPGDVKKGKDDAEGKKLFTVMEFTPDGNELLIGQKNGYIKVVDPTTAKYKKLSQELFVAYEKDPAVKHLVVSEDGSYFATSDTNNGVSLFKKDFTAGGNDKNAAPEWIFNGKIRSHDIEITGLCFGQSIDE